MLLLRKPSPDTIQGFLNRQQQLDFTYQAVGATANEPPAGYVVDHTRVRLGKGSRVFAAAKAALESWQQFCLGWLEAQPSSTPIVPGEAVAIVARSLGLWWVNACRIVYVIDNDGEKKNFGFAYGTLPDHAGSGEERFLIEMDDDQNVWYDILAFSRPHSLTARLGYPYMRLVQGRFGKQSGRVMQQIVSENDSIVNMSHGSLAGRRDRRSNNNSELKA